MITWKDLKQINSIIYGILHKEELLKKEWHIGTVDSVVSSKMLKVFVNGSTVSQKIPCNPDISFTQGDKVFVHFVNGDSRDKFVPYKRGV